MRAVLWFLALFAVAVAIALFAGNNQGVVTLFWPPWRVDLSVNLVLLGLFAVFVALHVALRAMAALLDLPGKAHDWRMQQKERAMHAALLDAVTHLIGGRFLRARKSAQNALAQERALQAMGAKLAQGPQLRALAHVLAAESAQSLQDRAARDQHMRLALDQEGLANSETVEGVQVQAARFALDDNDPQGALARLAELPQGAARRTIALRIKLKAARQARRTREALETARLLAKHRAFSVVAAASIVRGLAIELLNGAHDTQQLESAWGSLDASERAMTDVAIHAALRMAALGGDTAVARAWLLPAWDRMTSAAGGVGEPLSDAQRVRLVRALESGADTIDAGWLARIEAAQQRQPRDANLAYLAGMACMKRQLWGKAQQLLGQSALALQDPGLHRSACKALAELAEQRGDAAAAEAAWKRAAQA